MTLTVTIHMDNAAFDPAGPEAARILRRLATNLEFSDLTAGYAELLMDINGNRVGLASVKGRRPK